MKYVIVILLTLCFNCYSDSREDVINEARSLVGIRELTGNNDGEVVESILASAGAEKGDPWCAAFNYYVYSRAGYGKLVPRSAWSPDWVKSPTWKQGIGAIPKTSDTFGIYFTSKGRVAHTGIVEEWGKKYVTTIEGNTNKAGSREGDGVYRKYRYKDQIYAVRSWLHD